MRTRARNMWWSPSAVILACLLYGGCWREPVPAPRVQTDPPEAEGQTGAPVDERSLADFLPGEYAAWVPGQPTAFAWRPRASEMAIVLHTWDAGTGEETAQLWRVDAAAGAASRYWADSGSGFDAFPSWSEDGERLYFIRRFTRSAGTPRSYWMPYVCSVGSGMPEPLTSSQLAYSGIEGDEPMPLSVAFIPARQELWFVAREQGFAAEYQLFCYDWDDDELTSHGDELARLTEPVGRTSAEGIPGWLSTVAIAGAPGQAHVTSGPWEDVATWLLASVGGGALALLPSDGVCVELADERRSMSYVLQRPHSKDLSYLQWLPEHPGRAGIRLYEPMSTADRSITPASQNRSIEVVKPPWPTYSWEPPYGWSPDGARVALCVGGRIYVVDVP